MKELIIYHHLGLGDHFDCNGIVRYLLEKKKYDRVVIPAKNFLSYMVEDMYRDDPRIEVLGINSKDERGNDTLSIELSEVSSYSYRNNIPILKIGFENYIPEVNPNKNCWEYFYDQLNIPYEIRQEYFKYERDEQEEKRVFSKLNPDNEPYIFIHEDESRGLVLDRKHFLDDTLKTVENDITENALHFIKTLESATEIHSMESSFKTLIDFYCKQENLFYHDFRNQPLGENSNKNWKVINYG